MITETDKISKNYYSYENLPRDRFSWMFKEDLCNNIIPYRDFEDVTIQCSIEPDSGEFLTLICNLFPSSHYQQGNDLCENVLEGIQFMAGILVEHGFIVLELVKEKNDKGNLNYKLYQIMGDELIICKENIVQVINTLDINESKEATYLEIPREKCFIIEFPQIFGGKKKYLKFLDSLKELENLDPIKSFIEGGFNDQPGYDSAEHFRMFQIEMFRRSQEFKWHHRGLCDERFSGFFTLLRRLQFRRAQILFRDFLIQKISEIFSTISRIEGKERLFKIDGLVTIQKIDEAIENWKNGKVRPNWTDELF